MNITSCDIDFYEIDENWGDSELNKLLSQLSKMAQTRRIIGIFDRDVLDIVQNIEKDELKYKDFGNNVYAFCIPKPADRDFDYVSIEHYYPDSILKKNNATGSRLFLGSEFLESGNSTDGMFETRIKEIQNKVKKNGVIDQKVYARTDLAQTRSIALSKKDFVNLVVQDPEFTSEYDYGNFKLIFEKISLIQALPR